MAEWSNAAVLKTVDLHGSGGSNPSSSAKIGRPMAAYFFLFTLSLHTTQFYLYNGQEQGSGLSET